MRISHWVLSIAFVALLAAPVLAQGGPENPAGGKGPRRPGPGGPGGPGGLPAGLGGAGMTPEMMQEKMKQAMARLDKNGDGQVDAEEMKAAGPGGFSLGPMGNLPPEAMAALKKKFDLNGDGKLDQQEIVMMQRQAQQMFGNGAGGQLGNGGPKGGGLGAAGGAGGGTAGEEPEKGGKKKKVSPLVKRFDKDGDGVLNAEEKAAAQAEAKAKGKK